MAARTILWVTWVIMSLVTGAYCALSLVTFGNTYNAYNESDKGVEELRAVLAAAFFGSALVFAYFIVSFFVILGKTVWRSGAGFSYGFITSSSIHMAFMCLLCGLVLHGFNDEVKMRFEKDMQHSIDWSSLDSTIFLVTFVMAYIAAAVYVGFFIVLICTKPAVRKQNKSDSQSSKEGEEHPKRPMLRTKAPRTDDEVQVEFVAAEGEV